MINPPKTKEEAEKHIYDRWAGNPNGNRYIPEQCAWTVSDFTGWHRNQCSRKNGHGPDGLYFKQHAKKIKE